MSCHQRAITLCRQLGNRTDEAEALTALGDSALAAGDPAAARTAWETSRTILAELRLPLARSARARLAGVNRRGPDDAEDLVARAAS